MTTPQQAYNELLQISREVALLKSLGSLLNWDQETNMPRGATSYRSQQRSYVAGKAHRLFIDPRVDELLNIVEASELVSDPFSDAAVNVREWRHDYDRAAKVPSRLVEEISRTSVLAHEAWVNARRDANFALFRPHLAKLIDLVREMAEAIGYESNPYDALLDGYEPGETTANVEKLFSQLREAVVPLVQAIQHASRRPKVEILQRHFPIERQKLFGQAAAIAFGYDFQRGRIDAVTHPFATDVGLGDVRITTRYNERFFNESFFGILHETGHGLYEQNLPAEHYGTPRGEAVGMGVHESQSRLWENFVGRNLAYWEHWFPRAQQMYPESLSDATLEEFHFAINEVRPSFIRVEADEVTYNLHIMLRFELEQAIIRGDLAVDDIPAAWNERFEQYFGLKTPDDSQGCLQDVHWSFGGFGYFPTYTLGNLYAAQIFDAACQALPDLEARFRVGDFAPLLAWLKENIYDQGRRYRSRELIRRITGRDPDASALIAYLREKFGSLYDVDG
ncbi:MAG: carboxypeptidase M32 [Chloroflexi bacterium]|nr:carboxypeptidase M32 [Chloroflexota bacterium]